MRDLYFRIDFNYDREFIKFKGGRLKMYLRQSPLVQALYYSLKLDVLKNKVSRTWRKDVECAINTYLTEKEKADNKIVNIIRKDIDKCYSVCKSKPYEYFLFDLRHKNKTERASFITDISMLYMLTKTGTRKLHDLELNNKANFFKLCEPYFKRKIMIVKSSHDYNDFEEMGLSLGKVICKPVSAGCGGGIFVAITKSKLDVQDAFSKMIKYGGDWIVEEYILQSHEMSSWNPTSVNTVRFTTFKNSEGIHFHCPFMRSGRVGSYVDNGGRGGIYAIIDINTGKISSYGYDELGISYDSHPDSGIPYVGWQVPKWDELKVLASEIHETIMPKHKYIGWDFALTVDGWVLIEGNWGQYVCQQSCTKRGFKEIFEKYLK